MQASTRKNVFVIGANGYIGLAVSRAFVRAGHRVYGLVRRPESAPHLVREEVMPIVGSVSPPSYSSTSSQDNHYSAILSALVDKDKDKGNGNDDFNLDIIIMCTQVVDGYSSHFSDVLSLMEFLIRNTSSSSSSSPNRRRPLVLWTSGSKDYGELPPLPSSLSSSSPSSLSDIKPHTETSPISNSPEYFQPRAQGSLSSCFSSASSKLFDAAVLRPTNVYGGSSSYYGQIFDFGAKLASVAAVEKKRKAGEEEGEKGILEIRHLDPRTITHALHVDDCAEAYVALADTHFSSSSSSSPVAGQCFNIGSSRYETVKEIVDALIEEYSIDPHQVRFCDKKEEEENDDDDDDLLEKNLGNAALTLTWHQWIDSTKLRDLTDWTDRRMLFTENMGVYRRAYEAAKEGGHEDLARVEAMKKGAIEKVIADAAAATAGTAS